MLSLVLYAFTRSPFDKVSFHAMDTLSSRDREQSKKNVFIPTHFRSHSAQTAYRSEFFPIAMKTKKYVCYNSADNQ
ncbi:hypothetical protein B9T36_16065 [Acinetobacter sp. ANC 4204]|nr:hypothetical protein B9T36_16065 [Acinetobacter sp. ANC 4204]